MTTISYRDNSPRRGVSSTGSVTRFLNNIVGRWQKWQSERDIEALSFDVRKDLGWPTADADRQPK
jgi:hypothetical protein